MKRTLFVFLLVLFRIASAAETRPELVLQAGHTGAVLCVAISPDGKWLASGGADSTIKIWDLHAGRLLRTLYGHNAKVLAIAISPDAHYIVSSANDGTARLWDVNGAQQVREMNTTETSITSVAFASAGSQVLTASIHSIQIWNTSTGQSIRTIAIAEKDQGGRVLLSPDGRMYTTGGASQSPGGSIVPFGGNKDPFRPLKVIDIASGRELLNLKTDTQNPYATYVFSPDGRFLARRATKFEKNHDVDSVDVYDLSSGKQFADLTIPGEGTPQATGALAMSNDGKWLAAAGSLGQSMTQSIIVFDLMAKQQVRELQTSGMFAPAINLDVVSMVANPFAFSSDAKTLAYGGSTSIQLWDVGTGKPIARLRTNLKAGAATGSVFDEQMEEQAKKYGYTIEQAAEMKEEASGMMESMSDPENPLSQIMNMGAKMSGMKGADARAYSDKRIQFSPNGRWLISENRDEIRIWDIGTGVLQQQRTYMRVPVAFSRDGRLVAFMEFDPLKTDPQSTLENRSQDLVVRDLNTWTVISKTTFTGKMQPEELVFAPDGSWLAAKLSDEVRVLDPKTGSVLRTIPVGEGFSDKSVFDASGHYFAMGGKESSGNFMDQISSMAMSMQGVDMKDKKKAKKQVEEMQKQMAKMMGGGQMQTPQSTQYKIKIFDLQNGNQVQTISLESRPQQSVQFESSIAPGTDVETHRIMMSPDGSLLALETTDQEYPVVRIYNVAGAILKTTIRVSSRPNETGQRTAANPLAGMWNRQFHPAFSFSADGKQIAISSQDPGYAVKLYDTSSGNLIATLPQNNRVDAIAFHPGGKFLVSYIRDGSRTVWDLSNDSIRATLMEFPGLYFSTEWLVATPDGLFDGSPAAWGQIQWRLTPNLFDLSPVETFFNEFYYPGLLQQIFNAKPPSAPRDLASVDRRQPVVQLSGDGNGQTRELKVKIEIKEAPADSGHSSGSGAKDVRLFRNGTLVKVWRGDVLNGQASTILETNLSIVAGENRLVAYAFNHDNVKSLDSMWRVDGAESLKRKGTAYILSIGIDRYENQDFNLKYAVADANAFVENLTAAQNKLGQFEKIQPVVFMDQDATKANILAALRSFAKDGDDSRNIKPAQPEDAIFIYYAGHGTAEKGHFYMVPHDLGYTGARDSLNDAAYQEVLKHSISDEELQQLLENIGAAQTVLIIDACNSGQALESEESRRGPINAKGLAQLAYEKGMYVLAAAQGYQAALEAAKLGHGYLTYALVEEGIKTADADQEPKDGEVIVREWLNYAAERVPEMQSEKMQEARLLKHEVAFVDGEEKIEDLQKRSIQQPRIFYRREMDFNPLVILKP